MMYTPKSDTRLKTLETVSKLLDSQFNIDGFRFGLDPILNLIPFVGDGATTLVSLLMVYTMRKHGASSKIVVKMLGNVLIDFLVGAIPLFGWVFDFYFKANNRNLILLQEHYQEGKHKGSGKGIISAFLIAFALVMLLALWMIWTLTSWMMELIF